MPTTELSIQSDLTPYGGVTLQEDPEIIWLLKAANDSVEAATSSHDFNEELEALVAEYKTTNSPEELLHYGLGVVAVVGLHHVRQGQVTARQVLEAAAEIILDSAEHENLDEAPFSSVLADATATKLIGLADPEIPDRIKGVNFSRWGSKLERARAGDVHSYNSLFSEFELYGRKILRDKNYFLKGAEFDDLVQDCIGGLVKAIDIYDSRISSVKNFAKIVIERKASQAIKKSRQHKSQLFTEAARLSSPVAPNTSNPENTLEDTIGDSTEDPSRRVIGQEFLKQVKPVVTEMEYAVALHIVRGFSYAEISDILGCDEKAVDNASQRVKRKLKPLVEGILQV